AAQGYFVYHGFNTANTGSSVTLRVFYDGFTGTGAAAQYFPVAVQWDNVAITKATDFIPPQAAGSGGNLRPLVRINSPVDGTNVSFQSPAASLQISTSASDFDGTIAKVEFFSNGDKLGETITDPYTLGWSNFVSGTYQLTAVATDNQGATTVSAPVSISV